MVSGDDGRPIQINFDLRGKFKKTTLSVWIYRRENPGESDRSKDHERVELLVPAAIKFYRSNDSRKRIGRATEKAAPVLAEIIHDQYIKHRKPYEYRIFAGNPQIGRTFEVTTAQPGKFGRVVAKLNDLGQ